MKKKLIVLTGFVFAFASPLVTLAQGTGVTAATRDNSCSGIARGQNIESFLCTVGNLLNKIIPILVILGVVFFIWGVVQYVISDDEEAKSKGRDRIIAGLIGLAVIVGMWGLVRALTNTFFGNSSNLNGGTIQLPTVNY